MNTSLARGVNSRPLATLAGECIRLLRCRISSKGATDSVPTSSPAGRAGDSADIAPSSSPRAREIAAASHGRDVASRNSEVRARLPCAARTARGGRSDKIVQ